MQQQNIGFVVPPAAPVAGGGGGSQPSSRVEVSLAARFAFFLTNIF